MSPSIIYLEILSSVIQTKHLFYRSSLWENDCQTGFASFFRSGKKTCGKKLGFFPSWRKVSSSFFHEIWKKLKSWENIGGNEYHFTNNVIVLCLKSKNIKKHQIIGRSPKIVCNFLNKDGWNVDDEMYIEAYNSYDRKQQLEIYFVLFRTVKVF